VPARRSGLFTLRLAQADYTLANRPVFDPSNILRLEEFSRPCWGEVTNQVTVIYRDRETDKDTSVTVQDLAGVQMTGSVVATSVNFPGISKAGLANRVAMRELKQLSCGLAKVVCIEHRRRDLLLVAALWDHRDRDAGGAAVVWRVGRRRGAGRVRAGRLRFAAVGLCRPAADWLE
jgi:hypothetical protein